MAKRSKRKTRHQTDDSGYRAVPHAKISYHYVVLLDILGQRSKLAQIHDLDLSDPSKKGKIIQLLKETGELVKSFRENYRTLVTPLTKVPPLSHGNTADVQFWNDLHKMNIEFMNFSDTVCVFGSLEVASHPLLEANRIMSLQSAMVTTASMLLMYMGVVHRAIRGGIAVSKAWPIFERLDKRGVRVGCEIYGPALMFAHNCESKAAGWPRVVVHQSVKDYLDSAIAANGPFAKQIAEVGHKCSNLLGHDGTCYYLDYLGAEFKSHHDHDSSMMALVCEHVKKAYQFAKSERDKFVALNDPKLGPRYNSLVQYFESNRVNWPNKIC